MNDMPKGIMRKLKPDFMARAPRILLDNMVKLDDKDVDVIPDDDPVYNLDLQSQPARYYESPKVLGQLYRALDETRLVHEMKNMYPSLLDHDNSEASVLEQAWIIVQRNADLVHWKHLLPQVRHLKAA